MAELIIRLEIDPNTGKKNIIIKLHSDEMLLPHEHERMHRQLVDKILEGGLVDANELGELIVERDNDVELDDSRATENEDSLPEAQSEQS